MPRIVFRATARRDIAQISSYILRESKSRDVADAFIEKLVGHCRQIAWLPNMMGRARPELGVGYRSVAFGNYLIFLRYADEDGPRSHLYVVHIVQRARDLEALFDRSPDIEDGV